MEVLEAYFKVKSNKGVAGIDDETIADFESNLKRNLYKIWNRMSSGSYFPLPVRTVMIPKANGGESALGIPTVADRVAQMVVKNRMEPMVEPLFHPDSFGYRPVKSALEAVGWARQRCWSFDWVRDLDIKGFFDNIDRDLLMRAARKHVKERWLVLYIERWLNAPAEDRAGDRTMRERGTPQGGVISPLLANLFLHYAFDQWMLRKWRHLPFERYADDIIIHCRASWEANMVRAGVEKRLRECGLELHSEKTKLVYCKDSNRQERHPHEHFDSLGFRFRSRKATTRRGGLFSSFSPAVSRDAMGRMRDEVRRWKLHLRTAQSIAELAREINPMLRGWFNYYGRFNPSALRPVERHVGQSLVRWACRKYKTLPNHRSCAWKWLLGVIDGQPDLLALWERQRYTTSTIGAV